MYDGAEERFLYALRDPGGEREADAILFLERIAALFAREKVRGELRLFLTPGEGGGAEKAGEGDGDGVVWCNEVDVPFCRRRVTVADVAASVGPDKTSALVYVCGVPAMTDEFVEQLTSPEGVGMEPHRVLYEKWW